MTDRPTSPNRAIRAKCLDCCCGNAAEVRRCPTEKCPLWEFRFGKNPYYGKGKRDEDDDGNDDGEDASCGVGA